MSAPTPPPTISLDVPGVGPSHAVILPNFAARDDCATAWSPAIDAGGVRLLRVQAAAIALGTRIQRHAPAKYGPDYDLMRYGGDVYSWLIGLGVSRMAIAEAGNQILPLMVEHLSPREPEVAEAAGPLGASGAPLTGGRSD